MQMLDIVGRTVDSTTVPVTLTLQARELPTPLPGDLQHLHEPAQVTGATIYLSLLGPEGLARVAAQSHAPTNELVEALTQIPGVRLRFGGPRFHEAVLALDRPVRGVLEALAERGILGGYELSADYPHLGNALLVCATETKSSRDIETYAVALREILGSGRH
jgi:glycine dehydrogenase subunit 1